MTIKIITTLLLTTLFSFGIVKEDNSLQWSAARRLSWEDFKSRPDHNSTNAALTSSAVSFSYSYDSEKGFSYTIACLFQKNSSWGKIKTEYILAHEQGHFDIAEIFARRLNKLMKAYSFNPATAQKEVPAIYQQVMTDLAAMQNQYDSETDFSRDKEQQAVWSLKIHSTLENLKAFAGYH